VAAGDAAESRHFSGLFDNCCGGRMEHGACNSEHGRHSSSVRAERQPEAAPDAERDHDNDSGPALGEMVVRHAPSKAQFKNIKAFKNLIM